MGYNGAILARARARLADRRRANEEEQARRLLRLAESDRELYKAYHESEQYKARHEERFENTKDSAAYLFG